MFIVESCIVPAFLLKLCYFLLILDFWRFPLNIFPGCLLLFSLSHFSALADGITSTSGTAQEIASL